VPGTLGAADATGRGPSTASGKSTAKAGFRYLALDSRRPRPFDPFDKRR
jgi:hypothetical protein